MWWIGTFFLYEFERRVAFMAKSSTVEPLPIYYIHIRSHIIHLYRLNSTKHFSHSAIIFFIAFFYRASVYEFRQCGLLWMLLKCSLILHSIICFFLLSNFEMVKLIKIYATIKSILSDERKEKLSAINRIRKAKEKSRFGCTLPHSKSHTTRAKEPNTSTGSQPCFSWYQSIRPKVEEKINWFFLIQLGNRATTRCVYVCVCVCGAYEIITQIKL
jgi:hypothetical protein